MSLISIPEELKFKIFSQLSLYELSKILSVSTDNITIIRRIFSQLTDIDLNDIKDSDWKAIQNHCHNLRIINGLSVGDKKVGRPSKPRVKCTPKELFALLKNNPHLECLVLYDHPIAGDLYFHNLITVLGEYCPNLKMLYTEHGIRNYDTLTDLPNILSRLVEISLPNNKMLIVRNYIRLSNYHPTQFGLYHSSTERLIYVYSIIND